MSTNPQLKHTPLIEMMGFIDGFTLSFGKQIFSSSIQNLSAEDNSLLVQPVLCVPVSFRCQNNSSCYIMFLTTFACSFTDFNQNQSSLKS